MDSGVTAINKHAKGEQHPRVLLNFANFRDPVTPGNENTEVIQ